MPQFQMPLGGANVEFSDLPTFVQGYIEAMFFTSTGNSDDGDLEHATFDELSSKAMKKIVADCERFQKDNDGLLADVYGRMTSQGIYTEKQAGHDFWFSRNHHGVGYWDRDLGADGDDLSDASHDFGEVSLVRGDDNKLYLE